MRLNKIHIENFRCFKNYDVVLAPSVTVLIGKNGAGKSTLIHALHKALSFIFKKDQDPKAKTICAGITSLKVEPIQKQDAWFNNATGFPADYISIQAEGEFLGETLVWEMLSKTSTGNMQPTAYKEAFNQFINKYEQTNLLPVLAYYSDSFPHVRSKETNIREIYKFRNFGYYQWNEETACSSIWIKRFKNTWRQWDQLDRKIKYKELITISQQSLFGPEFEARKGVHSVSLESLRKERAEVQLEKDAIVGCLKEFTKGDAIIEILDLFINVYNEELCTETTNSKNYSFERLPAGYKRLLYIVMDIAYRSFILNGNITSSGVVIIDEIDLHLHPSLEQEVLERLQRTFPNIQFVVSTHSPLVITNLQTADGQNCILQMEEGEEVPELIPDIYGIDYNTGLTDIMNTPAQNSRVNFLMESVIRMIRRGKPDKAEIYKDDLKEIVSEKRFAELEKEIDIRLKME